MSLKIFYDPLISNDDGSVSGIHLVIKNKDKYLSVEDLQDNKFIFVDEATCQSEILDMTKQESLNKINDLINKVLE